MRCFAGMLNGKRTAVVILRTYRIVVERFQTSSHSSSRDKIYITADLLDSGNEIFPLRKRKRATRGKRKYSDEAQNGNSSKKIRLGIDKISITSSEISLSGNDHSNRRQEVKCFEFPKRDMSTSGKNLTKDAKRDTSHQLAQYSSVTQPKMLSHLPTDNDGDNSFVNLLLYVTKVTVLANKNNGKASHEFYVDGYSIGEFHNSVDIFTSPSSGCKTLSKTDTASKVVLPPTDCNLLQSSSDHVPKSSCRIDCYGLEAFNVCEKKLRITIHEKKLHHLLKSQNLYSIKVKRDVFDAAIRLRKNCLDLELEDELTIKHIQIDKGYMCTGSRKIAKLVNEIAVVIKSVVKKSNRILKKVTVRDVLSPACDKSLTKTLR